MQVQVDIGFDQLVQVAKTLPKTQWAKLKEEVEAEEKKEHTDNSALIELLLKAPTFSKRQLREIAKTRKAINQWRTK